MAVLDGRIRLFDFHRERLQHGCARLGIPLDLPPLAQQLQDDASALGDGVLKLLVTRGSGPRGYRPPVQATPARVRVFPHNTSPGFGEGSSLRLRVCETRLGMNPALAGIKHLNRLEQVMAQNEWHTLTGSEASSDEGLMLDARGHVVCATAANVLAVRDGALLAPGVEHAGVAGVMRRAVIDCARRMGVGTVAAQLTPADLMRCDELMLSNAVHGLRSVTQLDTTTYSSRELARGLRLQLREYCAT